MSIKPKLTTFDTTMIVVSLVIGIGIFRTPAMVAAATGTPTLFFLAWVIGGCVSFVGALTFAEIGSSYPYPGAYYKAVAEYYHSSLAFMLNWANVLAVQAAGGAAVAMIGAEYIAPVVLPQSWQTHLGKQLITTILVIFLLLINYLGIKTGAWVQNLLSLIKIGMILLLGFAAFFYRGTTPAQATTILAPRSFFTLVSALWLGLVSVFYTYGGYQLTINVGADVKQARRNLPRAIFFGVLIIISLYLLINFAYWRVLGISGIASAKLVAAEVARACFGRSGQLFISLIIFLSALGFVNATLLQVPRNYYAMAADRALPPVFMKLNPRTQVQEFTLLFLGAAMLVSIFLLGTFEKLVNYIMFLDSINIAMVASTIFFLRRRQPGPQAGESRFRMPLYPLLPALLILFLFTISLNVLLTSTQPALIGLIFFASGYPIFLLMRRLSSRKKAGSN